MKKGTRIFLISLIVILMLAIIAAFTYCTINKYAHAEYTDISNDTIVNFNQLFSFNESGYISTSRASVKNNILSVTTAFNASSQIAVNNLVFEANHKYYIYVLGTSLNGQRLAFANGGTIIINYYNEMIYEAASNSTCNYLWGYSGLSVGAYYVNVIDLTLMYGSNEPDLETCKQIFKTSYYYNKGTPMYFGLNQNDLLQHLEYRINSGILTGYNQNITNTQVSYNNQGELYLTGTYSENYSGYFLLNLKSTIPIGSIVTINFNSYLKSSGSSISLCYANTEEKFITNIPTSTNDSSPFSYTFITWEEVSAFYLICDNYSTGTIMTIKDATISVQLSSDYQFNLQAQYDLGYNDATTYYTQGYGRQEIWQKGFNEGKAKGLQEANGTFTAMDYVKSAFVTLGDIMNIEVFPNFTLGAFFLLPLITGAIFFIIKISKGG